MKIDTNEKAELAMDKIAARARKERRMGLLTHVKAKRRIMRAFYKYRKRGLLVGGSWLQMLPTSTKTLHYCN